MPLPPLAQRHAASASVHAPPALDWTEPLALPDPFARLMWQDQRLAGAGFPSMSPWWKGTLRAWYASQRRWLVALVGRGGGKSTTLTRVAACEGMFTARAVPPGQRWIWPFV